eukprot:COSAG06_NODE_649_length_13411_cov_129.656477_4_plen_53_part_00
MALSTIWFFADATPRTGVCERTQEIHCVFIQSDETAPILPRHARMLGTDVMK